MISLAKKAAAYARISTGKQDLDLQLEEIRQFAARKGWILVPTYSDVASGAREDRTDFTFVGSNRGPATTCRQTGHLWPAA